MDRGAEAGARSLAQTAEEILRLRAESLSLEAEQEAVLDQMSILLFRLGQEWYAVKVEDVREIFQEYATTPIPCVPDFILGVVNIRGEILSVTDLARLMRLGQVEEGLVQPPAIVLQGEESVTAVVVDEIGDIADIGLDMVEPPLNVIDKAQAEFVAGSIHIDSMMVGLLNVQRILEPLGSNGR